MSTANGQNKTAPNSYTLNENTVAKFTELVVATSYPVNPDARPGEYPIIKQAEEKIKAFMAGTNNDRLAARKCCTMLAIFGTIQEQQSQRRSTEGINCVAKLWRNGKCW